MIPAPAPAPYAIPQPAPDPTKVDKAWTTYLPVVRCYQPGRGVVHLQLRGSEVGMTCEEALDVVHALLEAVKEAREA